MDAQARQRQPFIPGPIIVVGLTLLLACAATSAQTFIIVTPEGARFSSSPARTDLRFDGPASSDAAVGATLGAAVDPARDGEQRQVGAPMPSRHTPAAWPRAESLDLSLDVQRFLPAQQSAPPPAADETPPEDTVVSLPGAVASAASLVSTPMAAAAGAAPARARATRDDAEDLSLKFNVRGFSLLRVDGDADTRLQFRRVREREWRKPILSLTLQKKF